jgi:hypothetical protein
MMDNTKIATSNPDINKLWTQSLTPSPKEDLIKNHILQDDAE